MTQLNGLKHSRNTNLAQGKVNNADAVLLLLHERGGSSKVGVLKAALRQWRPDRSYGYLFQAITPEGFFRGYGYGFVGMAYSQPTTLIGRTLLHSASGVVKAPTARRNFYYRTRRGHVAISLEGQKRLAELGIK